MFPADALLPRSFSATLGTAPTGRGVLKLENCPVHAYALADTPLSSCRRAPSVAFGKACVKDQTIQSSPALIGREAAAALLPRVPHATFGTAPRSERPKSGARRPHAYAGEYEPHKFTPGAATFGAAPRSERPKSGARRPHAYVDADGLHLKHTPSATFGTAPRSERPKSGAGRPHAYTAGDDGPPLKHTPAAVFGSAPQRKSRPSSGAIRPHAYADCKGGALLKPGPAATFGSEARFRPAANSRPMVAWRA